MRINKYFFLVLITMLAQYAQSTVVSDLIVKTHGANIISKLNTKADYDAAISNAKAQLPNVGAAINEASGEHTLFTAAAKSLNPDIIKLIISNPSFDPNAQLQLAKVLAFIASINYGFDNNSNVYKDAQALVVAIKEQATQMLQKYAAQATAASLETDLQRIMNMIATMADQGAPYATPAADGSPSALHSLTNMQFTCSNSGEISTHGQVARSLARSTSPANIDLKNTQTGRTSLQNLAALNACPDGAEVVVALLGSGASVDAETPGKPGQKVPVLATQTAVKLQDSSVAMAAINGIKDANKQFPNDNNMTHGMSMMKHVKLDYNYAEPVVTQHINNAQATIDPVNVRDNSGKNLLDHAATKCYADAASAIAQTAVFLALQPDEQNTHVTNALKYTAACNPADAQTFSDTLSSALSESSSSSYGGSGY